MSARAPALTDDEYAARLAEQQGGCAVCGNPPKTRRLSLDHNHRTDAVGKLLCFTCNHYVLGKYATVAKLRAAADYLEWRDGPR